MQLWVIAIPRYLEGIPAVIDLWTRHGLSQEGDMG